MVKIESVVLHREPAFIGREFSYYMGYILEKYETDKEIQISGKNGVTTTGEVANTEQPSSVQIEI